jgi:hypothetical protein
VTRTGKIDASQAGDATPRALFPMAAAAPATSVPCPWRSAVSLPPAWASKPTSNRSARSGTGFTPVSSTAITTSGAPAEISQAWGSSMW